VSGWAVARERDGREDLRGLRGPEEDPSVRWIRCGDTALDADRIAGFTITPPTDALAYGQGWTVVALLTAGGQVPLETFRWSAARGVIGAEADARAYMAQLERELADHKDQRCGSRARFTVLDSTVEQTCGLPSGHDGNHRADVWTWTDDYAEPRPGN
jgi:hypothetical protein